MQLFSCLSWPPPSLSLSLSPCNTLCYSPLYFLNHENHLLVKQGLVGRMIIQVAQKSFKFINWSGLSFLESYFTIMYIDNQYHLKKWLGRKAINKSITEVLSFNANLILSTVWLRILILICSGYGISAQALTAVVKAHDGRGPSTMLTSSILQTLGLSSAEELIGYIL